MSKIYCFRHAQASFLADNYDQLSPLGEIQSEALGKFLQTSGLHFDRVFCGPLERQKHTAAIVADCYRSSGIHLPEAHIITGLREHQGTAAMRAAIPQLVAANAAVQQWLMEAREDPSKKKRNTLLAFRYFMQEWSEGRMEVEEEESWRTFRQRVREAWQEVLDATQRGETVAVFSSGGVIAAICAEVLEIERESKVAELNFSIRNTSFSQILYSRDTINLLSFNELPHLGKAQITFV